MDVVVLADTHVKPGASGRFPAAVYAALGGSDLILHAGDVVTRDLLDERGPTAGRPRRMHRRFPGAAVVVHGHSHAPFDGEGVDGQILFNPGSPTHRRRQPFPTFGQLRIEAGRLTGRAITTL